MGQKVNPIGLRTALNHNWESRWFADKKTAGRTLFGDLLHLLLLIQQSSPRLYQKHLPACLSELFELIA